MYNMDLTIGSYKFRLEIVLLIIVVFWILWGHLICGCSKISFKEGLELMGAGLEFNPNDNKKEGFVGANSTETGPEFSSIHNENYIMKPSDWSQPNLTYSGSNPSVGVKEILDRPQQPVPLPEGEMDMFSTTKFSHKCCPNAYSSSTGCACMTVDQYKYLKERGGNNNPPDTF